MKKRKILLTLMVTALLIASLAFPAFAATVDLPITPVFFPEPAVGIWTAGTDEANFEDEGLSNCVSYDDLRNATQLVLEVPQAPQGRLEFILQTPANWWQQFAYTMDEVWQDGKIVLDFTILPPMEFMDEDPKAKFGVAYFGFDFADLGVTKAYLVTGGDSGSGSGNAKTGDSTFVFLAIGALVLAGGAAALIARKVKA